MKRALLIGLMAAVAALPLAASAQVRHDRQEQRQDRREYRQDNRQAHRDGRVTQGERRELRQDRRELNQDRRELRWDRNNRNWWRNRQSFRGYNGYRRGYWFAPGRGYYRVEPRWSDYRWRRGAYVPRTFWGYTVNDPFFYGLRGAPPGYRWIWLGNNMVLISPSGLIIDIVPNVY